MNVLTLVSKVNWKTVAGIGKCAITGYMAYATARGEQKQAKEVADKFAEMEKRLSELEKIK